MAEIMGINTDKIDEATINKYLERYGLAQTGKINRKLRILAKHLTDMKSGMESTEFDGCTCTTCGGESPGVLDECPFCGDGDTVDPENAATPAPVVEPTAEEPVVETKTPKKRSAAKKKVPTKKKVSARKKKAAKAEVVEAEVVDEQTGEVITTAAGGSLTKYDEKALDISVAKCYGFMTEATLKCYALGVELNHINDTNLYLLARDGADKSKWTNFKTFVKDEFGFSHQHAYNYMAVSKTFTEEQVREVGTHKLLVALKVPADIRQQILEAAQSGESVATLSDRANKLLEKNTPAKTPPVGKQLTAIIAMGLIEEPMFKAPTEPGKVGKKTKPATALNDEPFATFQLENGVEALFQVLKKSDGNLVASVSFRPTATV